MERKEKGGVQVGTTGTLIYDASREAPTSLKVSSAANIGPKSSDMNIDLKLLTDSMPQSSSPNSH
jgi:hypothetical protein